MCIEIMKSQYFRVFRGFRCFRVWKGAGIFRKRNRNGGSGAGTSEPSEWYYLLGLDTDSCSLSTLLSRKAPVVTMPCTKMTTRYPPSPSSTTHTTCTPTLPSATSYTTSEARRLMDTIKVPLNSQLQLPSIGSHLQGQLSRRSC
jgi:hypothetical protein